MDSSSNAHTIAIDLHQQLATGRPVPKELRLFGAGLNETKKGTFLVDEVAVSSVMERFRAHGVDLAFDVEHASHDPHAPSQTRGAAGWFKLEARTGEIWATKIEWVSEWEDAIRARKWRYLSPAFLADVKSNRVLEIMNVAITNMPATRNARPIAASARSIGAHGRPTVPDSLVANYALQHGCSKETARAILASHLRASRDAGHDARRPLASLPSDEKFEGDVRAYVTAHGCTQSEAILAISTGAEVPTAAPAGAHVDEFDRDVKAYVLTHGCTESEAIVAVTNGAR